MTDSAFRGPISNMGSMEDSPTTIDVEDGPTYSYQGYVISDLRQTPFPKDSVGPGRVSAFMCGADMVTVDNIPSAATTTILAAASTTLAATAVTLVTVAPGNTTAGTPSVATGVPLVPFGSSAAVTAAVALDFGFTTGTTTATSSTVVILSGAAGLFQVGQWIAIGGAANSSKTATLLTQVQSVGTSSITISPVAAGSLTNAPIGRANLWNNLTPPSAQFGPTAAAPTGVAVQQAAGLFRVFDPLSAIARNVCVQATTTAGAGGAFVVNGWDVYGQAMSETINVTAATTTGAYGKKAFKYIKSVIPAFTDTAGSYSVGVGDTFGFPVFARRYESVYWIFGGVNQINATGYLAPDLTNPATSSTGDVRGTVQFGTKGSGTGISGVSSNGLSRLYLTQTPPLQDTVGGTPNNTPPFYGVSQV